MKFSVIPLLLIVGLTTAQNETAAPGQDETAANATAPPELFVCNICGDGLIPLDTDGDIALPEGNFTCGALDFSGQGGQIRAEDCDQLIPLAQEPCGCVQAPTGSPTITWSPTTAPTMRPTFGPAPDCYLDLDNLFERELAVQDTSVPRVYKLCANNDFVLGRSNENGPGFIGGFGPFTPRANALYQCGENGLSSDNCVFTDGSFQIISFGVSFSEAQNNVTFKGITFEAGYQGSMLLANPGDITFDDCIIRNHQNIGPVIILFDVRALRRLRESSSGNHEQDVKNHMKMIASGEYEEQGRKLREEEDESERALQIENPDVIQTLDVTFKNCLFENNVGVPLDGELVRPGLITSQYPENHLYVDNCMFRGNDYGKASVQPTGWAISTEGKFGLTNSCFIDNNFIREAPVMVFDSQPVEASGNYGTSDDGLACSFLAEFPDNVSLETLTNFTCTDYDASTCQATVFSSAAPGSPTRPPRPSVAPGTAPAPTSDTPAAPTGGSTPSSGSVAALGRVFSSMLMTIAGLFVGAVIMA